MVFVFLAVLLCFERIITYDGYMLVYLVFFITNLYLVYPRKIKEHALIIFLFERVPANL